MWWLWMLVLCPLTGTLGKATPTEEMTGTLGGSVTFHLKTSKQPDSISWLRARGHNPALIAVLDIGPPCRIMVQRFEFEGRLNISGNCKNLRISNLDQSDSGTYKGQMKDDEESFRLKVYKNLLKSDLKVQCENYTHSDANYTLQLNCSAGIWEDGVNYTWTSQHKNGNIFSHIVQIPDDDANYTCTAENPVSKASLTVSVKQACEAPDDPSKTIYVQVGSFPAGQSDAKKPQPKKRTKTDDGIHTVYASVVQPKPVKTPLQTDDEKIQSESQRASNKSKKTIYSTVAAPQETDDHNIKTLYDTVSAPTGPKGSEFQKLL